MNTEREKETINMLRSSPTEIGGVEKAVIQFNKVEDYTTFWAEFAFVNDDVVLHFFHSPEVSSKNDKWKNTYWLQFFPNILSNTAQAYFRTTKPRIFAEYVPEMTSWYMKARGFALMLDPDNFIRKFLEFLDADLEQNLKYQSDISSEI